MPAQQIKKNFLKGYFNAPAQTTAALISAIALIVRKFFKDDKRSTQGIQTRVRYAKLLSARLDLSALEIDRTVIAAWLSAFYEERPSVLKQLAVSPYKTDEILGAEGPIEERGVESQIIDLVMCYESFKVQNRGACSDVNERALRLTRMNKKQLGVNVYVKKSNLFEKLDMFDCILTNPPYVAGRKTIYALIEQAKDHLNPGGSLQLVARHQKGGKMLEKKMKEVFGNVDVLGKKAGFRVYRSTIE